MNHLLHPDYFEDIPFSNDYFANKLNTRAEEVAANPVPSTGVTVAIRAFNEVRLLERLLIDIHDQQFDGDVEVVVVDNESKDSTASVARSCGAEVVKLAREDFSYPRSMNLAMEAASYDNVFLTVGHAALSNDQLLRGGVSYFAGDTQNIAGAFAYALPDNRASRTEKLIALGNRQFMHKKEVKKCVMGELSGCGSMIKKPIWLELGKFDERFETGGEDGAMAKAMLKAGYRLFVDPALTVHHAHGLGPINTLKQWQAWMKTSKPQKLDVQQLAGRRPDLNFD